METGTGGILAPVWSGWPRKHAACRGEHGLSTDASLEHVGLIYAEAGGPEGHLTWFGGYACKQDCWSMTFPAIKIVV